MASSICEQMCFEIVLPASLLTFLQVVIIHKIARGKSGATIAGGAAIA